MKKGVLILGATSAIARACAGELAKEGNPLFLAGRDQSELNRLSSDLRIRYGVDVKNGVFDADNSGHHDAFIEGVVKEMNGLEGAVVAVGYLGDQKRANNDLQEVSRIFTRNFGGVCSVLTSFASYLEKEKQGFIVGISSVAGDRGRQSNYVYGSAKAGFTTFLQGLRNRLHSSGVHVMTVKPGFVDTAMTYGLPGLMLVASPKLVGKKIVQSLNKGRNEVYVPWFWQYIMAIVKTVPERIFKKLKL